LPTLDTPDGFDEAMSQLLREWNAPGIGVSVVVDGVPVLARGYGYRDWENRLPFDSQTLFPIASNTKLFVAIAAGLLVEEGKLTYDGPLRDKVPTLRLYDDWLTSNVTLRDLLAHRTGITRHDMMTSNARASYKEIFDRLRFMKPSTGLRERFIYNNVMYYAVGHIIELLSGQAWTDFVRERILLPAGMHDTSFRLEDLLERDNLAKPFTERNESEEIRKLDFELRDDPPRPSGGMVSTLDDMARWVAVLMNDGKAGNVQIVPPRVLRETLAPAIPLPNASAEAFGWWELLNGTYGLGRHTSVYRGHLLAWHGGDIRAFHSMVAMLPKERIGTSVFVIGDHCAPLRDVIAFQVCERLLGLDLTPWSQRLRELVSANKKGMSAARQDRYADKAENTQPSHALDDYVGRYAHEAYGTMTIDRDDEDLHLRFRDDDLPLVHYHYDRFDTRHPDNESDGRWRINFLSNHEGDIDRFVTKVVENEVVFLRQPDALDPSEISRVVGGYESATGVRLEVVQRAGDTLWLQVPGQPDAELLPGRRGLFRVADAPGATFGFIERDGVVVSLDQMTALGRFVNRKL
jgi:CubicO group peptidase (beta-lactamase class C family)